MPKDMPRDVPRNIIDTIMIFAAGRGSRMQSLTLNTPKSLLKICNKPILYHILELISTYPFKKIIINTHYLHEQVEQAVNQFKKLYLEGVEVIIVQQNELLENGGAVKNAAQYFANDESIFTFNGDVIIRTEENVFEVMQASWQPAYMDFLLLLQDINYAVGYTGNGDFEMEANNRLSRPKQEDNYKFMYAGLNILKPELIKTNSLKKFSLSDYYIDPSNRLYGKVLAGSKWYHANRPQDLEAIEAALQ